jgi:hypothetical protein
VTWPFGTIQLRCYRGRSAVGLREQGPNGLRFVNILRDYHAKLSITDHLVEGDEERQGAGRHWLPCAHCHEPVLLASFGGK